MSTPNPQFTIRDDVVAACLAVLRSRKIHNTFAGYLCIVRTAAEYSRTSNLEVNFREFFDTFLKVPNAPKEKPYALPFWESPPSNANMFFNKNVAGSYAPSSLRRESPFLKVVNVTGKKNAARYSLRREHGNLALTHLLFNDRIPVIPLAAFLYRDYSFHFDRPSILGLVSVFQQEFGYSKSPRTKISKDFEVLYSMDNPIARGEDDWFLANR